MPAAPRHPRALPLHLLNELVTLVGLTPDAAAELTLEQAIEALAAYWRRQA